MRADGSFLRGFMAGVVITLGACAGLGFLGLLARDWWEQDQRERAAAAMEPERRVPVTGEPGDLLSEFSAAHRAEAEKRALPSPAVPVLAAGSVATPELLAGQSETKRNQMLVVDLHLQVAGRYPTPKELKAWLDPEAPLQLKLRNLRLVGEEDVGVANFIAGTLMEAPAYRQRFPAPLSNADGDGALAVGAILARSLKALPESHGDDATLLKGLRARFGLSGPQVTSAKVMTEVLRAAADTTDVGEHWLEPGAPVEVELDAMKTSLRSGRVVVVRGHDPSPRWVLVAGFDASGAFLVRDSRGAMGEKTDPARLLAFLRGAGGAAGVVAVAGGVWLDAPAKATPQPCPPPAVAVASGTIPSDQSLPGFTGVIEGAQVNLTRLRTPLGQHTMRGTMSATAEQIDQVLAAAHSPAAGTGKAFVKWGQYYNLDPVYALAFFKHESWFGTHPKWVGWMADGKSTRNIGNIRYFAAPDPEREPQFTGFNGFRAYRTWEDGIEDWFKLLAFDSHYAGLHTVEEVLPIYAPTSENDTSLYLKDVNQFVENWRAQLAAPPKPRPAVLAQGGCP